MEFETIEFAVYWQEKCILYYVLFLGCMYRLILRFELFTPAAVNRDYSYMMHSFYERIFLFFIIFLLQSYIF